MWHKITNPDPDKKIGNCSVCGPDVRIRPRYGRQAGTFRCLTKYMEGKAGSRFGDGTVVDAVEEAKLLEASNGRCAICKQEKILVLDHCHSGKRIRDFLCNDCNIGLGRFYDNPQLLREAADYLDKHSAF